MTVKQLITLLLECEMDNNVVVRYDNGELLGIKDLTDQYVDSNSDAYYALILDT